MTVSRTVSDHPVPSVHHVPRLSSLASNSDITSRFFQMSKTYAEVVREASDQSIIRSEQPRTSNQIAREARRRRIREIRKILRSDSSASSSPSSDWSSSSHSISSASSESSKTPSPPKSPSPDESDNNQKKKSGFFQRIRIYISIRIRIKISRD